MRAEEIAARLNARRVGPRHWVARCPAHDDRNPSLSIGVGSSGQPLLHCFSGCDFREICAAIGVEAGALGAHDEPIPPSAAQIAKLNDCEGRSAMAVKLWSSAAKAKGTLVETYLASRGLAPPVGDDLRFVKRLPHPSGQTCPAMIGAIRRGANRRITGVHRTWLADDGQAKTGLSPPKAMLGPAKGGGIWFGGDDQLLIVAEGIETTLSLSLAAPAATCCAALSTSGMKSLQLPETPSKLVIGADGDPPGRAAARELADRAARLGWRVKVLEAPNGSDWNDELQK